jgi:hypothetical protein
MFTVETFLNNLQNASSKSCMATIPRNLLHVLTRKGPLVPTGDKPVLGCVVMISHYFKIFRNFSPTRSLNKLRINTNFMILGATVQKLWVFEVLR